MATGYYHKYNVLKFRVLDAFVTSIRSGTGDVLTSKQIAEIADVEYKKVADILCHWKSEHNFGYVRRLPKKDGRFYRYKLTKRGIEIWSVLQAKYKRHHQLKIFGNRVFRMQDGESYFGVNYHGRQMGLTEADLLPEEPKEEETNV